MNLVNELRKQRSVSVSKDLLFIKEYDTLASLKKTDTLERVGLGHIIVEGKRAKAALLGTADYAFNPENIFHKDQIRNVCHKYYLRCLPAEKYIGLVDKDLPNKIETFEIATGIKMNEKNSWIVAPVSQFKLEISPKQYAEDPLFLYQIDETYFYLLHKWGNDLTFKRRLLAILANIFQYGMSILLIFCALAWGAAFYLQQSSPLYFRHKSSEGSVWYCVAACISLIVLIFGGMLMSESRRWGRMVANEWDSPYVNGDKPINNDY